ncbi:negative elongation factor e [Plakobranchus ocellatus]|uniref:Negative elongation factor E n=1 Tax=Plakobranchus ocellatus TaxID=259542 RepID=A0AAV4BAT5_9GAST|nr:negative elongation factor e [Plakobranchus ocellatus]
MAYLHFPSALSEEEETLKQTFAKLKKKKKQLVSLKAAAQNQEKETNHHNKTVNKPAAAPFIGSADKATEQAKKLVQSGAIKMTELKERSGFKRSKTLEKKKDAEKPAASVGFQPFVSFTGEDEEDKLPPSKRMKGLGESFVSAGYGNRSYDRPEREPPKKGNTIFVQGFGITEDMLQKVFSKFGKIVNINMERERNKGFVTFEKMEAADKAISEINGSMISNTQFRVSMARRQPSVDSMGDASSTSSWSSIASSNNQKGGTHRDKREKVTYDADDIF